MYESGLLRFQIVHRFLETINKLTTEQVHAAIGERSVRVLTCEPKSIQSQLTIKSSHVQAENKCGSLRTSHHLPVLHACNDQQTFESPTIIIVISERLEPFNSVTALEPVEAFRREKKNLF